MATSVRNSTERTYALRMILLGEAGAGKTCLYHWIKYKSFRDDSNADTGQIPSSNSTSRQRQYNQHTMHINVSPNLKVMLTVVDTTDGERFQSLTAQYYRRTNIVLLVCSLDDEVTLNRLTKWYQDSQYYIDENEAIYAVCGIKSDLHEHQKEITLEMMQQFAKHIEFPENCVFAVSPKTGSGINDMLKTVCSTSVEKIRGNTQQNSHVLAHVSGERSILLGSREYSLVNESFEVEPSYKHRCFYCCCRSKCVLL